MRGLCVKLEGQGLICNWILNYRGLGAKICIGLGLRVDLGKAEGPECKSGGNMITRELFF
jgi:hypothetical protein